MTAHCEAVHPNVTTGVQQPQRPPDADPAEISLQSTRYHERQGNRTEGEKQVGADPEQIARHESIPLRTQAAMSKTPGEAVHPDVKQGIAEP